MSEPPETETPKLLEIKINLTAQELADIIWLMVQINPVIDSTEVPPVAASDNSQTTASSAESSQGGNFSELVETVANTAPAYVESPTHQPATSEPTSQGLPIKITDPLALRNSLALGRSLRSLMRKVPSLTETVLDEAATVTSIAEEDFWLPVLTPLPTRWLEVALVIEQTPRLPLWQQILREFQQLLERHGAFRHVSLWYLNMSDTGEIELYLQHRLASFKELNDPSGRRLIWLVSDCVSPMWHNGSLLKILRTWAKIQPVSLLQLLPERLWSRTALGWGMEVQLYSQTPGVPNTQLLKTRQPPDKKFHSPQAFTLPVVTLEALPMKNWAKVLAGVGGSRTPGLVFLPEEMARINSQVSHNDNDAENKLTAEIRVKRFQAAAYPLSRQLAQMMAAAPVSLPVIRLIQQTMLPNSHAIHLAEVFMGGLLQPIPEPSPNLSPTRREVVNSPEFSRDRENPSPNLSPTRREAFNFPPSLVGKGVRGLGLIQQDIKYNFYPGVREQLIKNTRKSQTFDVLLCLSKFINEELQLKPSKRNFDAILFDPDVQIDSDYLPFAEITAQTLQLLGGKYAALGKRIQQKIPLSVALGNNQILIPRPEPLNRIFIFIDGDNLTAAVASVNMQFNYQKLLSLVQQRARTCQAYFYLTVANKRKKQLLKQLETYGYKIGHLPIVLSAGWTQYIDSVIIADLINLSHTYDTAILVSGNSAFVEPIRQIQSRGKTVELISFSSLTSQSLIAAADNYLDLSSESLELVALPTEQFATVTVNRRGEIISRYTKVARYFTETIAPGVRLEMVAIPGGKFMMGSPPDEAERSDSESPQHEVTVSPFFMGKYPVTQAQWHAVASLEQVNRPLELDPSYFKGENLPVETISWYEAVEFCDRLSKHTQRNYRLPSEAEWEYACRAGTTTPFHFGETITSDLANYYAESTYGDESEGKYVGQTTPVGSFNVANGFGSYDMHGNVWEWCADYWHENYEGAPVEGSVWIYIDNLDDSDNHYRLRRGGSWLNNPRICRSAYRSRNVPGSWYDDIGFRVVVSAART